jgi:hypothetical protein
MTKDLVCSASDSTFFAESVPYDSLLIEWTSDLLSNAADGAAVAVHVILQSW